MYFWKMHVFKYWKYFLPINVSKYFLLLLVTMLCINNPKTELNVNDMLRERTFVLPLNFLKLSWVSKYIEITCVPYLCNTTIVYMTLFILANLFYFLAIEKRFIPIFMQRFCEKSFIEKKRPSRLFIRVIWLKVIDIHSK